MAFQGAAGIVIECLEGDLADHGRVVIAHQAGQVRDFADLIDDQVGIRSIADQIPKTPGLIRLAGVL